MMVRCFVRVVVFETLIGRAGLHLQPEGYKIVFQGVMDTIAQQWPEEMPEKLPWVFPVWHDEDAWKVWESTRAL